MNMRKKFLCLTLTCALCAALLAGCGSTTKEATTENTEATQQTTETVYSAGELTQRLNAIVDSNSSNLAQAAAGLVAYAAAVVHGDNEGQVTADLEGWFDGLTDQAKETLSAAMPTLQKTAGALANLETGLDDDLSAALSSMGVDIDTSWTEALEGCQTVVRKLTALASQNAPANAGGGQAAGFDEAALTQALDDICSVGSGAAGSSLRAAKAAGELVAFAAENWNDGTQEAIRAAVDEWASKLDQETEYEFHQGFGLVESQAEAIVAEPWSPDVLGMLEDAGLELRLSEMDLSHTGDLLTALRQAADTVTSGG